MLYPNLFLSVVMLYLIYFLVGFYLEIVLKLAVFGSVNFLDSLVTIFFLAFLSLICASFGSCFSKKVNKIILFVYTFFVTLFFAMQLCIVDIFKTFFSFHLFGAAGQVLDFTSEMVNLIIENIFVIIILFIPFILISVFHKKITFVKMKGWKTATLLVLSFLTVNLSLLINKDDIYSSYNLFYKIDDINLSVNKLGVSVSFYLDVFKNVTGFQEEVVLSSGDIPDYSQNSDDQSLEDEEVIYEYNNLDIEFNSSEESLDDYFGSTSGTLKNEYTSLFEGKNLIYIMAETFNEIVVDEERTPTLYKLVNEGFNFENFYSPTIYSTIGGEFELLTGLYPANGFVSEFKSGDNIFPFGLSTVFENLGYNTYAYHNNTYTFQNRYLYLDALGFDNFLACNNGMENLIDCSWLASDKEMFDETFSQYKNDENFMVFYATVSGHGDYYYEGEFTKKYLDLVDDSLSEGVRSYLAAQIELDRALESLLLNLENEGILDDTVIVLAGDHHPYYLDIDEINEASDYIKDETIEVDHSNLIIYSASMEESVVVEKVGSTLDVLPTVYNLFGIEYDSRLIIGNDILSTAPGLAVFSDRSWVSDYGYYYASTNEFVLKDEKEVTSDYVNAMNAVVTSRINASSLIMSTDYYKYYEDYFN